MNPNKQICFCTLALGKKYQILASELAKDLEKYGSSFPLVVGTDDPKYFSNSSNVLAFELHKQGILHCYHDKRFVLAKALADFDVAICIDADTRVIADLPTDIDWKPGITAGHQEDLIEHVNKYSPERLGFLKNMSAKLDVSLENSRYIGESLFIIARDGGKEQEFLRLWGLMGRYLELKGIHSGEGNAMGIAAAKVGWTVYSEGWENLRKLLQHLDASYRENSHLFEAPKKKPWDKLKRRLDYHYRLNRLRLMALQDFDFYYR
jgi:hypothetical protein